MGAGAAVVGAVVDVVSFGFLGAVFTGLGSG